LGSQSSGNETICVLGVATKSHPGGKPWAMADD